VRGVFLCELHRGGSATELVGRGSIVRVQGQGEGIAQGDVHHRRAVEPTLLCDLQPRARRDAFAEGVCIEGVVTWFIWPFGDVATNAEAVWGPCRRGALELQE